MIVVTAPTGQIGGEVVRLLLDAGERVRVIVRDPAKLSPAVRDRVEVVTGSHADADVVNAAFAGADAVFWLVPSNPQWPSAYTGYVELARAGVEAFVKHKIAYVVGISALGRGTAVADQAGLATGTLAMDDLIAATVPNSRALANPGFMDNALRSVREIQTRGTFSSAIAGDRKLPHVATRDIAAVAAGLLINRDWTGFAEVPLLGPEDLSCDDQAAIMADVLGTPVTYVQTSGDAVKAQMISFGASEAMAQGMVDMLVAKDSGLDEGVVRTPENSTPTTFRQWCIDVLKPAFDAL